MAVALDPPMGNDFHLFNELCDREGHEVPDHLSAIPKFGMSDRQILFLENEFLKEKKLWGHLFLQEKQNRCMKRNALIASMRIGAAPAIVGRWRAKRRLLEIDLSNPHPQPGTVTALAQSRKRKSREQIEALDDAYLDDYYPDKKSVDSLIAQTGLKKTVIKSYFQHRRQSDEDFQCQVDEEYDNGAVFSLCQRRIKPVEPIRLDWPSHCETI